MSTLASRLREERTRLGVSQEQLAASGGVQRRAQTHYESGERTPDAAYLMALSDAGVDVLYVLTGERSAAKLSAEEQMLLAGFRSLDMKSRAGVFGLIGGMTQPLQSVTKVTSR